MTKTILKYICFGLLIWFLSKLFYLNKAKDNYLNNLDSVVRIDEELNLKHDLINIDVDSVYNKRNNLFTYENTKLNNTEEDFLKKIRKFHPEIEIPKTVTRKFYLEKKAYQLIEVKFNYIKGNDHFYFELYPYYEVSYFNNKLEYSISAGTASNSIGTIIYNWQNDDVIKIDYSYGTGSGSSRIYINGIEQYENFKEFDNNQ